MMNGVSVAPAVVGREREHPERAADPVVCRTVTEERAVTAIVLDHEQPDQKSRGWHREQQWMSRFEAATGPPAHTA